MRKLASLFLLIGLATGCATNPATGRSDLVFMSEAQEIALGREYHAQVMQAYRRYDDEALQEYVSKIGRRLAADSHRSNLIFRFTVLDSDEVNAFALPGGYVYITRGIMAYVNTEAELAAILGHEIGHVTARHSVRQHASSTLAGVAGVVVAVGTGSRAASDLSNILGAALVRGYGRDMELEADKLGAGYAATTGYDPQAMIEVIELLKNQEEFEIAQARRENREPRVYHGVFSTHPDQDTRLQEAVAAAADIAPDANRIIGRETYLRRLDGMSFGKSKAEGVLRGNNFYHDDLGIALEFPRGWRVDNLPQALSLKAPGDSAQMQISVDDLNLRLSPREFLRQRVKVDEMTDNRELDVGGLPAFATVDPRAPSPYGTRAVRYAVVFHGDRAFLFMGAAKSNLELSRYDNDFLAVAASMRDLTAAERELTEPAKLRLRTAGAGDTIAGYAAVSPITNYPEDQLRLLNDLYPAGEPQPGELIKIVE